jgi:prevent-host-death family protein
MIKTGIKEARQHFTEYLAKVEQGEEIIITKRNEPIARISSLKPRGGGPLASRKALRESLRTKGKPLSEVVIASRKQERY